MKKNIVILVVISISVLAGIFIERQSAVESLVSYFTKGKDSRSTDMGFSDAEDESETQEPLYWVAPMDSNYRRDNPGKSPMGMDLIPFYPSKDGKGVVDISSAVENNLGVRVGTVTRGRLGKVINTVGYVSFDEDKLIHFHSRVEGWIQKISVTSEGDKITKGQALFELYSPQLVNAQEEYLAAIQSGSARLLSAARSKLAALGVSESQISQLKKKGAVNQSLVFYASQDGYVASLNVREGSYIKPASEILSLGELKSIWVVAEIPERQGSWVMAGQSVAMTTAAYPNETWQTEIDYVYPVLDIKTRTVRARIRVDNTDLKLRPNMFVKLAIKTKEEMMISVPREAIIRSGTMDRVVKSLGGGKFISTRVYTGIESGDRIQITMGLEEGDEVVISAQFLIDSESSLTADLSRIDSAGFSEEIETETIHVVGQIQKIVEASRMITIRHEPIASLDWPSMTMDFLLADDIDLNVLEEGMTIGFCIMKNQQGNYLVTHVEVIMVESPVDQKEVKND